MKKLLLTLTAVFTLSFGSFAQNVDVGVTGLVLLNYTDFSVILPGSNFTIGDTILVGGTIENFGDTMMAGDSIHLVMSADGFPDLEFEEVLDTLLLNGEDLIFAAPAILLTTGVPAGSFEVCVTTAQPGDSDNMNDESCQSMVLVEPGPPASIEEIALVENLYYANNALRFKLNSAAQSQLTLVDLSGKVVMQEMLAAHAQEISLGDIPNGIYIVRVQSGNDVSVQKIAKF